MGKQAEVIGIRDAYRIYEQRGAGKPRAVFGWWPQGVEGMAVLVPVVSDVYVRKGVLPVRHCFLGADSDRPFVAYRGKSGLKARREYAKLADEARYTAAYTDFTRVDREVPQLWSVDGEGRAYLVSQFDPVACTWCLEGALAFSLQKGCEAVTHTTQDLVPSPQSRSW